MKLMRPLYFTLFACALVALAVAVGGCAAVGGSPESQIQRGAQTHTAATNLAANLLQRDKITVAQAKSYRGMLGTASDALDTAYKQLADCRKRTGSTPATSPDPCQGNIAADVNLALSVLTEIERTLKGKE